MSRVRRLLWGLLAASLVFSGCNSESGEKPSSRSTKVTKLSTQGGPGKNVKASPVGPTALHAKESSHALTLSSDTPVTVSMSVYYGKIKRESGGKAASGATVELVQFRSGDTQEAVLASTRASADGGYEVATSASAEMLMLRTSAKGSARLLTVVSSHGHSGSGIAPKVHRVRQDISLPDVVELRGKVIDENDQPVTSASLRAMDLRLPKSVSMDLGSTFAAPLKCSSGQDGSFGLEGVAAGKYTLYVESPRHVPLVQEVKAPGSNVLIRLSSQGAVIEGSVFKLNTSEAVASATVELYSPSLPTAGEGVFFDAFKTVSNSDGTFRLDRLPKGDYLIQAQAGELKTFMPLTSKVTLDEKETTSGVKVYIYGGHTIKGKVTERQSGKPISGVKVSVASGDKNTLQGESDDQGQYRIEKIFSSGFVLTAQRKGYKHAADYVPVSLSADKLEIETDIQMVRAVQVSGLVRMESGSPVAGAWVGVVGQPFSQGEAVQSDAQGIYELEVNPFRTICIQAETSGYPAAFSEPLRVDDRPVSASELIIKPGAKISGTVVDPAGNPVENAGIYATLGLDRAADVSVGNTLSDRAGAFTFSQLPEGSIHLSAKKKGYAPSKKVGVETKGGQTKSGVQIALQASHFISGKVTDGTRALEGATVRASSLANSFGGSAVTDAQGQYRIEDIPAQTFTVVAQYQGAFDSKDNVATDSENVDLVVKAAKDKASKPAGKGKFTGKVIDWKSRLGISDFSPQVFYQSGVKLEKDSSVPGRFEVSGLRAHETFGLKISAPGYMPITRMDLSIDSEDKTPVEREFVLEIGGTISGRVVERGGAKPLEGVLVLSLGIRDSYADQTGTPVQTTHTGADGTFSFEKVAPGTNVVEFRPAPPLLSIKRNVEVGSGSVSDLGDVELGGGVTLTGRVLKKTGQAPVTDTEVQVRSRTNAFSKSAKTGADGSFRMEGLAPGNYGIAVPKYQLMSSFQIQTESSKEITLYVGSGTLNGVVLKRGQPLQDAHVNLTCRDEQRTEFFTRTDSEGKFRIEGITASEADVMIQALVPTSQGNSYPAESRIKEVVKFGDQDETNHTFDFPWARVTGRVVDSSGSPVADTKITIISQHGPQEASYRITIQSGSDGTFSIEGLRGGQCQLSASKSDLGFATAKVTVAANADSADTVVKLEKTDGATLVSKVVDTDGKPIPGAWCYLDGLNGRYNHNAVRDAQGLVTVNDIPPGSYAVSVGCLGYSSSERQMELKAGESQRIDDVLYPAGTFRWTIEDKSGITQAGVPCTLTPLDPHSLDKPRRGATGDMGQWIVRDLFGGDYTATATPPSGKPLSIKVTITAGQLTAQNSQLE